jgi:hypothetical protein
VTEALNAAAYGSHKVIFHFLADLLYFQKYSKRGFLGFQWELCEFAVMGSYDVILDELVQPQKPPRDNYEDVSEDRPLLNWRVFGPSRFSSQFQRPGAIWYSLFRYGVAFGHKRAIRRALANGFDGSIKYNRKFGNPAPALVPALRYGHRDIVSILLEGGAGQQTENVENTIIMASRRGFTPVVQLLMDYQSKDPSVNKARFWESSFQPAAKYGQVHVIDFLVPLGLHLDRNSEVMQSAISVGV